MASFRFPATFKGFCRCEALQIRGIDVRGAVPQVTGNLRDGLQQFGAKLLKTITQVARDLRDCAADVDPPDLEGLTPAEAFERGREAERGHQRVLVARAGFVADWPERVVKVRKLLAKVRR